MIVWEHVLHSTSLPPWFARQVSTAQLSWKSVWQSMDLTSQGLLPHDL
jgi:hypothetical protein